MPETREITAEHFAASDEPTPQKIGETVTTIEVSDEEVQAEADEARLKEIISMAHSAIKVPALAEGFKLLCKKLGFD